LSPSPSLVVATKQHSPCNDTSEHWCDRDARRRKSSDRQRTETHDDSTRTSSDQQRTETHDDSHEEAQIGEEQRCATTRRRSNRRRPETRDEKPESAKGTKPRRSDARTVNGDTQRATDGSDLRVEGKETRRRACGLVNRAVWGPLPH
jgi:hypothetical protein